jgi:signal transduction histidine kinase
LKKAILSVRRLPGTAPCGRWEQSCEQLPVLESSNIMVVQQFTRILVVEDNRLQREMLCDFLAAEGFEAVGCRTAAEGIEELKNGNFGVAVIDLGLPDISGTELLEQIRWLYERVRVIIHTGLSSYESLKDALNLGAFAYVEKRSDLSELMRHINRACRECVDSYAADLEAAVAQRTAELARSNGELTDFAAHVAHDLRSPLLTISGYCQVLKDESDGKSSDKEAQVLERILDAVERMGRLIDDLLKYSQAGQSDEPLQDVSLEEVLVLAKANLEAAICAGNARIEAESLPTVPGDSTQLVQLFQNLIDNAVKFRRDVDPVVKIRAKREGLNWLISVEDNGIGMEGKNFNRVFNLFQRLLGRKYPGSGVGLAVSKKIVERHGGRIWLESTPGRGTTFFFTIPASPP